MDYNMLIEEAFKARDKAYAPYSNYKVGACILLKDGTIIHGCNIENAAYGCSMCGERNAIYQVYCRGYHKEDIEVLVIVANSDTIVSPCGECRQVLAELMEPNTPIVLSNKKEKIITNIKELLPLKFSEECL